MSEDPFVLDPHATWQSRAGDAPAPLTPPGSSSGPPAPPKRAILDLPQVLAGRYELSSLLGEGGYGTVYRARDRLAGEDVAVKLMRLPSAARRARARTEVTALRRLRLPGVVGFRDDGELPGGFPGGDWFVVMDLVLGAPFLVPGELHTWDAIAERVRALVEILARVHFAGVVHRDLKPGNVLLDGDGHPVLLDLGLATGQALAPDLVHEVVGTVRYVAPEQLTRGEVDGRADLYSLGVMLFEALSGMLPQPGRLAGELLRARLDRPARPLRSLAPAVPEAIARTIDALLERDPASRPASALDLLSALGGAAPSVLSGQALADLPDDRPAAPEELRFLFAGPDAFFHFIEDGAAVLHQRTGGQKARIQGELSAWIRAGLAFWQDGKVVLDRVAIGRLRSEVRLGLAPAPPASLGADARTLLTWARRAWPEASPTVLRAATGWSGARLLSARAELMAHGEAWPGEDGRLLVQPLATPVAGVDEAAAHMLLAATAEAGSPERLRHLYAAGADARTILDEVEVVIEHLRVEGRLGEALAVLEPALALARHSAEEACEQRLLVHLAKVNLARETRAGADLVLYELGRCTRRGPEIEQLERLLRAWRANMDRDLARTEQEMTGLGTLADEELEIWAGAIRMGMARLRGREEWAREVEGMEGWAQAGGTERLAKWKGWLGNLRRNQGRFAEAAVLHREAVEGKRCQDARLASLLDVAWDLLDGLQPEGAKEAASQALELARRVDHPEYEANAYTILRAAAYRAGRLARAEPDRVHATAAMGAIRTATLAQVEAATAFRSGDLALARDLAETACNAFERAGTAAGARLLRALLFALGAGGPLAGEGLVRAALQGAVPGIDVQALGLVALRMPALVDPHRDRVLALARSRPESEWPHRREILSIHEALRSLPPSGVDSCLSANPSP